MSGAAGRRDGAVTARALTLPARTWGREFDGWSKLRTLGFRDPSP
jgi:hypothetical protein